MKCKDHPAYKAVRKPRTLCEKCWAIWTLKRIDQLTVFDAPDIQWLPKNYVAGIDYGID